MLGELVPCGGGDTIPLLKDKLLVGRRSRCDITLRFPNISSHHCELEFMEGFWFVRDMNSSNGIKVNDVRCESKWLMPGDVLSVAKHRYEIEYTPTASGSPPEIEENPFRRSLLEKAGLAQSNSEDSRSRSSTDVKLEKKPSTDEDKAVEWLNGDNDDNG